MSTFLWHRFSGLRSSVPLLVLLTAVLVALPLARGAAARAVPAQNRSVYTPSAADVELFQQGIAAMRANHLDEAVEVFTRLTKQAPRFAEAYLNLGLAYTQQGQSRDAIVALQKGIALQSTMRGAHLFLAIAEYKTSQFAGAAEAVEKETALNPKDAQAWMWQGIIHLALGQNTASVEDLDRAAALKPEDVDILYHRGRAALALSRQSYEAMFKLDPHSWHVAQVLAEADVEQGNDADAITQFQAAIATAPPQSGLFDALGSAYWRSGKYPEAAQAYEQAVALDPDDVISVYKLGCLRVDRGDAAGGKPLLEKVAAADPSLTMTSYYLGRAEIQLGNDQAAIADFEQTIAKHLDDDTEKQAYFQLSRAYRRIHNQAASQQAQQQYRLLEDKTKQEQQEKMNQRRLRGDRDVSIPAPPAEPPS